MQVNSIIEESEAPMQLSRAILLYEQKMAYHTDIMRDLAQIEAEGAEGETLEAPRGSRALASLHDVHNDEATGRAVIGPGLPLERDRFEEVMSFLSGNATLARELLPERLLFADSSLLLWWAPAARRTIYFSTADKKFTRDLNGKTVAHPPLVFAATPSFFSVFALEKSACPTLETPLYVAPYCNLYEAGNMCRGDVALPKTLHPPGIPAWEQLFFDSRFTHSNLRGAMTTHKGGHNGLWRDCVKAKTFDAKWLLRSEMKMEDILK